MGQGTHSEESMFDKEPFVPDETAVVIDWG
jgi:hypothetical protein